MNNEQEMIEHCPHLGFNITASSDEVERLIDLLVLELNIKARPNILRARLRMIISGAYQVTLTDNPYLAYSRDNNRYRVKGSRYNVLKIGRGLVNVIDAMVDAGYFDSIRYEWTEGDTMKSRLMTTQKLSDLFSDLTPEMFYVVEGAETVVLKDSDKWLEEYTDNSYTVDTRAILEAYQELINPAREHDKFVRRIHNNSDFSQGGRVYGGFWQHCKSEKRKDIKVDGEPTVEMDYSAMMPTMVYASEGIDYWKTYDTEPYYVEEYADRYDEEGVFRKMMKQILIIMLNTRHYKQALGAIESQYPDIEDIPEIIKAFTVKHKPIAKHFYKEEGLVYQRMDSDMIMWLIETFTREGITIYPVHDSILIKEQYAEILRVRMTEAFNRILTNTGLIPVTVNIKIE